MSVQVKGSGTIGGLDEGLVVSGIVTSSTQINVGSNIKLGNAGVITATSFVGSGANLTSLPAANLTGTLPAISGANLTSLPAQATVNNNADNRVITGGSGVNLYAESGFTYDGTIVQIPDRINLNTAGTYIKSNQIAFNPTGTAYLDHYRTGQDIQIRMSTSSSLDTTGPTFKSNGNLAFASGKGIDFSATGQGGSSSSMSNELLSDYEEGTWVPVAHNFTIAGTYHANYTRIGRMVHITMWIQTNTGSSGAPFYIAGLPYTVKTGNVYQYACGRLGSNSFTNSQNDIVFEFTTGNTTIFPKVQDGGMNWGMASGTHVMLTGSYIV